MYLSMRKIVLLLSFLTLLFSLNLTAQNVDASRIKQLVIKHAAALGLSQADLANYRVSAAYYDENTGLTMAYLQQIYKGVDVYNAIISVAFKKDDLGTFESTWITGVDEKAKKLN